MDDGAGHALVTAYALERPDGQSSLLIVNRDQQNSHRVRISFQDEARHGVSSFAGPVQILLSARSISLAAGGNALHAHDEHAGERAVVTTRKASPIRMGPSSERGNRRKETLFDLPAASVTVIRGKIGENQ